MVDGMHEMFDSSDDRVREQVAVRITVCEQRNIDRKCVPRAVKCGVTKRPAQSGASLEASPIDPSVYQRIMYGCSFQR